MTQSAITSALNGKAASSHTHSYLPLTGGTLNNGSTQCPLIIRGAANNESSITFKYTGQDSGGHWVIGQGCGLNNLDVFGFYKNGKGVLARLDAAGTFRTNTLKLDTYYNNGGTTVGDTSDAAIRFSGGSTEWGIVKTPNSLQIVNATTSSEKWDFCDNFNYCPNKFNSAGIYETTSSGGANVYISGDANLKRSTSASKYKLNIKPLEENASYPYNLLKLEPKQWFDKGETERYAELLSKEYNDEEVTDEDRLLLEDGSINPYYGLIAEDVEEVGLSKFCVYDKENKEIEGIMYDRLPVLMIPILKDIVEYIKLSSSIIKEKITDKDMLEKVNEIVDRMK